MADEQQTAGIEQQLKALGGTPPTPATGRSPVTDQPPITTQLKNLAQTLVLIERELTSLEKNFTTAVGELRRLVGRVGS